jgi:L-iditol 2-dehydrogenase
MKSMLLTGIRQMELGEVPTPEIRHPTDVLIRMVVVGVCGSDVHYYATGRIGSQVVKYPYPVGHEGAGVVEKVGPAVTRVKPGDRIAVEPAMSCGACDQCLADRPHTCRKLRFLGCPGQAEGCIGEFLVMPEACCFPIPDGMTLEQAALSEPLAIGVYAVRRSVPMAGARIGILGFGPIGLSVLFAARAHGADKIYVSEKLPARVAAARKAGADWAGNPDRDNVVAAIQQAEPLGLDVVFECCGQQEALLQAVDILKPGGKLMLIGIPPTMDFWQVPVDITRRKEICIQNVRRQAHCVEEALDLIATGKAPMETFATHHFPLAQTKAAFDLVEEYRDGVMKAMIEM